MESNIIIDLNETFNNLFYKKFTFILDNKIIKTGRLKLFTMKAFNLKFFLADATNEVKAFELPYPFDLIKLGDGYIFDYSIKKIKTLKRTELLDNLEAGDVHKSRFYNKPLILKIE